MTSGESRDSSIVRNPSKNCGRTINRTGLHRARTGPEMTDYFASTAVTIGLKVIKRANYPQLIKGMNSSRRLWWVSFRVGMDVFSVWCLFSYSGSRQMPPHAS